MKKIEAVCRELVKQAKESGLFSSTDPKLEGLRANLAILDDMVPLDPTYALAVKSVRDHGRVSVTYISRRCGIPYKEAVKIIERLEVDGIVSPLNSMGERTVIEKS